MSLDTIKLSSQVTNLYHELLGEYVEQQSHIALRLANGLDKAANKSSYFMRGYASFLQNLNPG